MSEDGWSKRFTSATRMAAARVVCAMAKRAGAPPAPEALRAAADQMERTVAALRWIADNGVPAELQRQPLPVPDLPLEAEPIGDDEGELPLPRRRGRPPKKRGRSQGDEQDVCGICGVFGHGAERCPEVA